MATIRINKLTDHAAVIEAIRRFDLIGRKEFLAQNGYGRSTKFLLVYGGRRYDSKAIAGVAFGIQHPGAAPIRGRDFSGGDETVVPVLAGLGFEVIGTSEQSDGRSYWALLARPDKYDIEGAIESAQLDLWRTRSHALATGDRILIWRSRGADGQRGIVGFGHVVEPPTPRRDNDNPYWLDPGGGDALEPRTLVRYITAPGLPLWLGGPARDLLNGLSVARARGGTVFKVNKSEWDAIVARAGGWPGDDVIEATESASNAISPKRGHGQGFRASAEVRRRIEDHAMEMVEKELRHLGWSLRDVSTTASYDFHCTRGADVLRVEVKGTTGDGSQVLLTRGEVMAARRYTPQTALYVVSKIELDANGNTAGGDLHCLHPWAPAAAHLEPIGFVYTVPHDS